ncbi:MAG TPA: hypothetical protein VGG64_08975 [Pirellulales bacterium]
MIEEYQIHQEALSRFFVGATLLGDAVLAVIRRELQRLSPKVRIDVEDVRVVLEKDVIKRDVLEGDKAEVARKRVARAANVAHTCLDWRFPCLTALFMLFSSSTVILAMASTTGSLGFQVTAPLAPPFLCAHASATVKPTLTVARCMNARH